jgi:hypothetical protein
MALTITELDRGSLGKNSFRLIKVTQDEATSTIAAASIDLTYIEACLVGSYKFASAAANTSTMADMMTVSVTGDNDQLEIGLPAKVNSTFVALVIGW